MPRISFFRSKEPTLVLPHGIHRLYCPTRHGDLEILSAQPSNPHASPGQRKSPIFFAHGGCGSAAVWLEFMQCLSQQYDIPCYAVSYRGHGDSWYPGYWRMFFTRKHALAEDLVYAMKYVQTIEAQKRHGHKVDLVLVGHSSGGGLAQYALSEGLGNIWVKGLVLMGSIPCFGNNEVNKNWLRIDPWFLPRMIFKHLGHPMSPLSSTRLVKQAFFCPSYPIHLVRDFERRMPVYESLAWPLGMGKPFANAKNIVNRIAGWARGGDRVLILAAQYDKLCAPSLMERMTVLYRKGMEELEEEGEMPGQSEMTMGVRYDVVSGAGHHMQNDLQWQEAAKKVLEFYEQL